MAANGELPLMIMLSGGLERLLPVLSFAQGLLAAMAVYELTRRCGGGRRGATCALLLALSVPIVMHHMYVNYVDLFGASMWLASILAVAWAGRAAGRHRTCLWLIAGLAAGLAAGTRLTFVFFAGITAVALAVNAWMVNRSARMRTVTRASVWFSLAAICCCWFWPVRACIVTGNPIFPAGYDHGHWTIGQAAVDDVYGRSSDGEWLASRPLPARLVSAVILPWREYQYGTGYRYSVDGGTGAAFAMMAPLGLILIVPRIIRRASTSSAARRQLIVGGMLLAGLLLHVTIFRTYTRYSLGFVLLAISLSAIWYDRFIAARPRLAGLMLTLALSISGVMAAIEPARALGGRLRSGNWGRAACYEIPDLIDRLPPGTVIANAGGTSNNYALLGKDLTNRVIGTVEWQSWMASTRPLEQLLRDNQVAYLYVRGHLPAANGAAPMYWPADLPLQCVYEDSQPKSLSDNLTTRVFSVVHAEETNHVAAR